MSQEFSNWQISNEFLNTLINRIQRRTDEDYAVSVMTSVIGNLRLKNDFFSYIDIVDNRENDDFEHIVINQNINKIPSIIFYRSINQLFNETIRSLGHVADFFFIREFKKSLGVSMVHLLLEGGVNLDLMQTNYILEQQEMFHIENDTLLKDIFTTLMRILNKKYSIKKTIETMFSIISTVEKDYSFLKYVKISTISEDEETIEITVYPEINTVWSLKLGEAIQKILKLTKKEMYYFDNTNTFEKIFQERIGRSNLYTLDMLGVNFFRLGDVSDHTSSRILMEKVFYSLVDFIGEKTSIGFAVSLIDNIINKLREKHLVLKHISIDNTQYQMGIKAISIDNEINNAKPHELGKVIRDIIQNTGENLDFNHKMIYIDELKKNLGKPILKEFDSMGINLHVIELKMKL